MKERPIIFNSEMVRAILKGEKTQTRRPVKPAHYINKTCEVSFNYAEINHELKCPFGKVGDVLWVRETYSEWDDGLVYRAFNPSCNGITKWKPSIHMPKWACRLKLKITDISIERVQGISEEDAQKEGVNGGCLECGEVAPCSCNNPSPDYRDSFIYLWNSIYKNWGDNPWVWKIEFEVIKRT